MNFALSDISDLSIQHVKEDEKESLVFTKKPEIKESISGNPFHTDVVPESWLKPELDDKKIRKQLNISEPLDDDELDTSNICFISDSSMPIFNLAEFEKVVEYKKDLFQNVSITTVFERCKYLWFNIKNSDCRYYLSKNLSKSKYNILLVYEADKKANWIKEIQGVFPEAITINKQKLIAIDSFSPDDFIASTLSAIVKISKPTKSLFNMLKMCVCSSKKKG